MVYKNKWLKSKEGKVEHAFFGEMKKTISTTLPISVYEFAKINNLQFSSILTNEIRAIMGDNFETRENLKIKIQKLAERFQTILNVLEKHIGEEGKDKILKDVEFILKTREKAKDHY